MSSYCEHHKRDRKVNAISVTKHKRNDHNVGNDRRDRGCPFACIAKLVGKECTDKCGNASENDVNRNRTAKKIGDDTSHEQSRDGSRCEERKHGQRLGKPDLNFTEAKWREYQCQDNIYSCNGSSLYQKMSTFVFHVFYSPLVLFYEWKVTNTRHIYRR